MTNDLGDIVLQAQAGELDAFDELITRYQDFAFATAMRFLGERAAAQDAAQDAFIEAYYSLSKLREPSAFGAWLRRIVLKHCDRQVRGFRPKLVPIDTLLLPSEQLGSQPHPLLEQMQFTHAIRAQVAQLPEIYRIVSDSFYLKQQSLSEIATRHDLSYSTTKKRLYTARQLLKARMQTMSELQTESPKVDGRFSARIRLFIAVRKNDLMTVRQILHRSPELVHETAKWDAGSYGWYGVLGATPLHWAVGQGELPLAKVLHEFGADVNAMNERVAPPLHNAVQMRRPEIVEWLLANGAEVNAQTNSGQTALHVAVIRRQVDLIKMLLTAGADCTIKDEPGRSPIDWAVLKGYKDCVALLREQRCESSAEPQPTFTPSTNTIWETGIKIIDLMCPLKLSGANLIATPLSGVGGDVILSSLMQSFVDNMGGWVVSIGETRPGFEIARRVLQWRNYGIDRAFDAFFVGSAPPSEKAKLVSIERGVATALEKSADHPVLVSVRTTLAQVDGALDELAKLKANPAITLLWNGNETADALPSELEMVDALVTFMQWRRLNYLFPAVDPVRSFARQFESDDHAAVAQSVRRLLARYIDLDVIYHYQGFDGFDMPLYEAQDKIDAMRARLLHHYLCQRLPLAEPWSAVPGQYVTLADGLAGAQRILDGEIDWTDEKGLLDFGRFTPAQT